MLKHTKILVYINVGLLTFFFNIADVSSSSHIVFDLQGLFIEKAEGLPTTIFGNTNPIIKKSFNRGLASEEKDLNQKNKKVKIEEKKENEESESYSLLDPNLYEGGSDGASDLLEINQIHNRLNQ